ncbi:MAG: RNA-binding protein [Chitinivibrionales bacterium]|nr:RNA-binding protein [Chitinivibrionales bacterium]
MGKKLYVGNLSWGATEEAVRNLFAQYGAVTSVSIITDRETGRSRGFAFVEMEGADEAIAALNGKEFDGRALKVNEAQDKPRTGGGGGGSRGGYGGGGGGGRDGGRRDRW